MTGLSLLTFTTLYPNARQPNHGVFVENRLRISWPQERRVPQCWRPSHGCKPAVCQRKSSATAWMFITRAS